MDEKELQKEETQEFSLEDIIKEFGDPEEETEETAEEEPEEAAEENEEAAEETEAADQEEIEEPLTQQTAGDTIRMEAVRPEPAQESVNSDTIRLDTTQFTHGEVKDAVTIDDEDEVPTPEPQPEGEAFTGAWEPEYEQPMGEYIPPQPIIVHPRSRLRELKRKLVAGPEKRYYELSEVGVGKLQFNMFITFFVVVGAFVLSFLQGSGYFTEERLRFVVFGQLFLMLLSALLGSFQLIEGVADLFRLRFTLNSLMVFTFAACCFDAAICLRDLQRVPCCSVFTLEMFMSMWAAYHRRTTEMGVMDTMRKAVRLDKIVASSDYFEGKKGLLRGEGQVEDLMDSYSKASGPEKVQWWFSLSCLLVSLGIGVFGYLNYGLSRAVALTATSLLASVPATAFIALTRPMAVLEKRLHALGAVICGWRGVKGVCGKAVIPMDHDDLFPAGSTKMNGVKFFGDREPDEIVAYCTALVTADGGGLAPLFNQVLDSRNGRHYDVEELQNYDGGIGGVVCGEPVLVGSLEFLKTMGVEVPEGIRVDQAVCVSIDGELSGLFAVTYEKSRAVTGSLATMCGYRRLSSVLVNGDFMLTEGFLRSRFGINPKRLKKLDPETCRQLREKTADPEAPGLILSTREGLAPFAYAVTGARSLRTACRLGLAVHMLGGIVGMGIVLVMALQNGMHYLTPSNMFLYHLVWMVPGWLITNWTKDL